MPRWSTFLGMHGRALLPMSAGQPTAASVAGRLGPPAQRSVKWRLLSAQEHARPCFMTLQAVRHGDALVDFEWSAVDPGAARMLRQCVGNLLGQRLLEVMSGVQGHRRIFDHYARVFVTGRAESALQLHAELDSGDVVRHAALKLGHALAVTLINFSALRRAQALQMLESGAG